MTRILPPDAASIAAAATALREGRLVAFPTETVYGLGAHALDPVAVQRIFEAKGRPSTDPLIVHVVSVDRVADVVAKLPAAVPALARAFWPGPLTLVLPRGTRVPYAVTAGLETVAVRVPSHPVARALLAAAGIPIAAPSANLFSRPSPTTAAHVLEDLRNRVDIILDGGPTDVGVESTVLDLTADVPTILRPGAVTDTMLRAVLPRVEIRSGTVGESEAASSPGQLAKHYAPRAPLTLYDGPADAVVTRMRRDAETAQLEGRRVGVIAADDDDIGTGLVCRIGPLTRPDLVAARLYAALRELDASGVDQILARQYPSEEGLGRALRDRLGRAASQIVIVS